MFGIICATQSTGLNPRIDATRLTGVAPLAALFDATRSVNTANTAIPFHELDYAWDGGDPNAGTHAYGSGGIAPGGGMEGQTDYSSAIWLTDKNKGYGPLWAKVYDLPGTYYVTLTLTAPNGATSTKLVAEIVVTDPAVVFAGANTVYISASGSSTDVPGGYTVVTDADWKHIVTTYVMAGKRVLLHTGETYTWDGTGTPTIYLSLAYDNQTANFTVGNTITGGTSGATAVINADTDAGATGTLTLRNIVGAFVDDEAITDPGGGSALANGTLLAGPGTIGTYGSGTQPLIQLTADASGSAPFLQAATGATDWRVQNLKFDCNSHAGVGWNNATNVSQILLYQLTVLGAISAFQQFNNSRSINGDQFFVVNCSGVNVTNVSGKAGQGYGIFVNGVTNSAFMGNDIENFVIGNQHTFRMQRHSKCVINHNYFARSGNGMFLVHGDPTATSISDLGLSNQLVISDNVLVADDSETQVLSLDPQHGSTFECSTDTIFERNFVNPAAGAVQFFLELSDLTIRNNILNFRKRSGGVGENGFLSQSASTMPGFTGVTRVYIYNNTIYLPNNTGASSLFRVGNFANGSVAMVNNLEVCNPSAVGSSIHLAVGGGTATFNPDAKYPFAGNSSNAEITGTDPAFTNGSGTMATGFSTPTDYTPTAAAYLGNPAAAPCPYNFFRSPTVNRGAV